MVSFCDQCGALLSPKKDPKTGNIVLVCPVCKSELTAKNDELTTYQVKQKIFHSEKDKLTVIEEEFDIRPITKEVECPKCGNHEARYWVGEDRRKEDWEAVTYYRCTKCKWVWSE